MRSKSERICSGRFEMIVAIDKCTKDDGIVVAITSAIAVSSRRDPRAVTAREAALREIRVECNCCSLSL